MKKMLLVLTTLIALSAAPGFGADAIQKMSLPAEVRSEISSAPEELNGLRWNRWTSDSFVVCSIDDVQAQYLHKHLEHVKTWSLARWGLPDVEFSAECKLICVGDPSLFKKLFNLTSSRVEIRRDESGKIKETVIFLLADGPPSATVPVPVMEVALAEFSQRYNLKPGVWAYRGMAHLNGSIAQIRQKVLEVKPVLDSDGGIYFSKGILTIDPAAYDALPPEKQALYDRCAMLFCFFLRREFGQDRYLEFLKFGESPEAALKRVYGFSSFDEFDRSYGRFLQDLTREVGEGRTPDLYFQIREK